MDALYSPLPSRQMNPAMLRYFDPVPSTSPDQYSGRASLSQHYSTFYLADSLKTPKNYLADMELYVVDINAAYRWQFLSLHIDLPLIRPLPGSFDALLNNYHQALGLPDGGRKLRPDNVYAYQYTGNNRSWKSTPQWELGNLAIQWRYSQPFDSGSWSLASAIKLPTASQSRGWSSGGSDIALGFIDDQKKERFYGHVEIWWIHPLKRHDIGSQIQDYYRSDITLGIESDWPSGSLFMLQLQGGSSPYRTNIISLDQSPWLISFGLQVPTKTDNKWTFGFVENITQNSTQDFGLMLEYQLKLHAPE